MMTTVVGSLSLSTELTQFEFAGGADSAGEGVIERKIWPNGNWKDGRDVDGRWTNSWTNCEKPRLRWRSTFNGGQPTTAQPHGAPAHIGSVPRPHLLQ